MKDYAQRALDQMNNRTMLHYTIPIKPPFPVSCLHFTAMKAPNRRHEDYFFCNRIILRCAGLWEPESVSRLQRLAYRAYAIFVFVFVNIVFTATEFVSLLETRRDLHDLIKNINFALTHLMGAVKCCFWFFNHRRLLSIISTLEGDEFTYEEIPGKFSQRKIMERYRFKGALFTLSFFAMAHLTLTSSYAPSLIQAARFQGNGTFSQKLPYFSWMPFRYDTSGKYMLALGYQAGPMFSYAYSVVGMDTLFMNMMNFVVGHLLVLQGAFKTIRERCVARLKGAEVRRGGLRDSEELDLEMMGEMRKSIRHLQTIFKYGAVRWRFLLRSEVSGCATKWKKCTST